jgi:hypothetical protein
MVGPDWALVLLVVYPLVQIPLVLYLSRWFELDGDAPIVTPTRALWTGQVPEEQGPAGDEEPRGAGERLERHVRPVDDRPGRCRRCGAENDPAFSYCGSCVAPLS